MRKIVSVTVILLLAASVVFAGGGQSGGAAASSATSIRVEMFDRGTDGGRSLAHDNAWTNWIKDKVKRELNIDVTFVPVGRWSENTDIVNLMASNSAPDLCYTYNGDMISEFRDLGGILNLAPFIDQYLPDLKKLLGDDPALSGKQFIYRNADTQTGAIYSIPSYRVALAERNIFIRKDWLDALGLPLPTNMTEFYNALVAFRDRDPGRVGNRLIPLGQDSDARWGLANFINHFINPNLSDRDRWVYNMPRAPVLIDGYKEGVREMNKWYNERLIYQDFPLLTTTDDYYNLIKTGVVGAFSANWDIIYRTDYNILNELKANVPGADYVPIDIARNKNMMDKVGLQIFIPMTAYASGKHIAALQYLNWLAKPENYEFLQRGHEGINHFIVNGVPNIYPLPAGHPWIQNSAQNIDITMPMNGVEMGSTELNARVLALSYGNIPAEVIVNAYEVSTRNARAAVVHQATTRVNQYSQILSDKVDQMLAQAIRAPVAQFDAVWDAAIRDYLSSGGQEVLNERNSLWPR